MTRRFKALAPFAVAAMVLAACSSASPSPSAGGGGQSTAPGGSTAPGESMAPEDLSGQSVSVIGAWGGSEEEAFRQMVKPWEDQTGATVNYTGTRDLNAVLTTGTASGVLPDLAGLPGPGQLAEFAQGGSLKPLDDVLDIETYKNETAPALVDLGTQNGQVYGVFIKASVKGLMWYNPSVVDYSDAPATWDDLKSALDSNASKAQAKWCLGIESGAASGWPATDWIEDIVLRQSGPDVYNQWWQGQLKWTSDEIKSAFQTYGEVVQGAYGGVDNVLTTNFANAGDPLFASPPGCQLLHQASFITGLGAFADKTAGTDYDFFQFPDMNADFSGAVEGAGDLFGMFHDTPAAKSLMRYLVTAPAQAIWVGIGGALSANTSVTDYPDDIAKRSADILTNAKTFVFDASDLMPNAMNQAFWDAMLQYTQNPGNLDSILQNLDSVQADAYGS